MQHTFVDCVSGTDATQRHDRKVLLQNICQVTSVLREIMELDGGFVDVLLSKKTLSRAHVDAIAKSVHNKIDKLLDFLIYRYKGDYSEVLDALTETDQKHVVNFINSAGGYNEPI
jgi:hypothetical protein